MYCVIQVDEDERTLKLDLPISATDEPNNPLPIAMARGESAEVWLLEECSAEEANPDMQVAEHASYCSSCEPLRFIPVTCEPLLVTAVQPGGPHHGSKVHRAALHA